MNNDENLTTFTGGLVQEEAVEPVTPKKRKKPSADNIIPDFESYKKRIDELEAKIINLTNDVAVKNKQLEQITKKSNKIVKLYNELLAHYLSDDEE